MSELQRLQAKCRGIKASVTKLIMKVEDVISADLEGVSTQSVSESRKLLAETTLVQLKHKKGQIMELDDAIGAKIEAEQEFEEEITNADTYQITLDENIAFLSEFIRKAGLPPPELQRPPPFVTPQISPVSTLPPPETSNQTVSASSNVATADSHVSTSTHVGISTHTLGDSSRVPQAVTRLPKQSLPTFSGDPLEWQTFWDSFDAAINKNVGLSGVQKFTYLHGQVQGDAARVIAGFPLTDDNYAHAITLLQARYGQPHKLISAHMEVLLNLEKPTNTLSSLLAFHDTLEQHMRSLSSLGKSSEAYGSLLTPSVLSKLPTETKKHMARDHPNSE